MKGDTQGTTAKSSCFIKSGYRERLQERNKQQRDMEVIMLVKANIQKCEAWEGKRGHEFPEKSPQMRK